MADFLSEVMKVRKLCSGLFKVLKEKPIDQDPYIFSKTFKNEGKNKAFPDNQGCLMRLPQIFLPALDMFWPRLASEVLADVCGQPHLHRKCHLVCESPSLYT